MRIRIENRTDQLDPDAQALIQQVARSIDERLSDQDAADTRLDVHLDLRDDGWYEADLELTIPAIEDGGSGQTIHGRALGLEPSAAILDAVSRVTVEFDRYRWEIEPSLRNREEEREQPAEAGGPIDMASQEAEHPDMSATDQFRQEVARVAAPLLRRHASHEVAARQLLGDLDPGWIDPMEMVDEVMAEKLPTIHAGDDLYRVMHDLVKRLVGRIDQAVHERYTEANRDVSTELTFSEMRPGRAVQELGREIVDWWQPDAGDMRYEDMLTEEEAEVSGERADSPEALTEELEDRRRLLQALFREPDDLRRIFSMHVLDGWSIPTVASVTGRSETEVKSRVREVARSLALSMKASEGDHQLGPDDAIERYRELGERLRSLHAAENRAAERPVIPPVIVEGDEDEEIGRS